MFIANNPNKTASYVVNKSKSIGFAQKPVLLESIHFYDKNPKYAKAMTNWLSENLTSQIGNEGYTIETGKYMGGLCENGVQVKAYTPEAAAVVNEMRIAMTDAAQTRAIQAEEDQRWQALGRQYSNYPRIKLH